MLWNGDGRDFFYSSVGHVFLRILNVIFITNQDDSLRGSVPHFTVEKRGLATSKDRR